MAASGCWPLLWAVQLVSNAQDVGSQVRNLEEELRLEKDVQLSATQLALELAGKVGE